MAIPVRREPGRVRQDRVVDEQSGRRHSPEQQRQTNGRLDDSPNPTLVHTMYPLVEPWRINVRQQVREHGDAEEHARAVNDVPVQFLALRDREACWPYSIRII
mgnify:CR=1 FL=1